MIPASTRERYAGLELAGCLLAGQGQSTPCHSPTCLPPRSAPERMRGIVHLKEIRLVERHQRVHCG